MKKLIKVLKKLIKRVDKNKTMIYHGLRVTNIYEMKYRRM